MFIQPQIILKSITALCMISLSAGLVSCGGEGADIVSEPAEVLRAIDTTPTVREAVDPIIFFRIPKDDHLPSDDQLKQGVDSSIGKVTTAPLIKPTDGPSTTIKPPNSSTEGGRPNPSD